MERAPAFGLRGPPAPGRPVRPSGHGAEAAPLASAEPLLAAIAAHRDREAFRQLFSAFAPRIKRYLCARGDGRVSGAEYWANLSPDSRRSLELQGGIFGAAEADAFIAQPHAAEAVSLRLWDDLAKQAGADTPPFAYYLAMARRVHAATADAKAQPH